MEPLDQGSPRAICPAMLASKPAVASILATLSGLHQSQPPTTILPRSAFACIFSPTRQCPGAHVRLPSRTDASTSVNSCWSGNGCGHPARRARRCNDNARMKPFRGRHLRHHSRPQCFSRGTSYCGCCARLCRTCDGESPSLYSTFCRPFATTVTVERVGSGGWRRVTR